MPRSFTPKVVTANHLMTGAAVWLTPSGDWSGNVKDAELITDAKTAELRLLDADAQAHLVVGAYLAEARSTAQGTAPTQVREVVRTRGPSNYHHGKQAKENV
ncbi:MAG: DUF2849 domain-containing protein [Octadecabacter sp.]|nr:DUF2849 domain-containing protein [Octadecabacter sp.]